MKINKHRHALLPLALLAAAGDCAAGIVAHYKFDEAAAAATALNAVAGGPTGAVGSSVTTGVTGVSGNAYSFAGATTNQADIVDMANASFFTAINTSGKYSFSTWIKTADTTGGRNTVIFAGDNTQANVYADLGVAAAQVGFLGSASARNRPVGAPAGAQQTGIFSSPAVPPVNDDAWHHLVMTVDVATGKLDLWVDGVLANSQTMPTAALPVFNNFEIGRLGRAAPVDPYQGLVDDVQVYDHVLRPVEIAFLKKFPGEAYTEADTDADGLVDAWERVYFDNITAQSGAGMGPDLDGATNLQEQSAGTNPLVADTDGDGRTDGAELNTNPFTDPADPDSDDDSLTDGSEVNTHGTDPNNSDTDSDSLPDAWEIANQLNPLSGDGVHGDSGDPDADGLLNFGEYNGGINSTNPRDPDSDDDGYNDSQEDRFGSWGGITGTGTNPLNPDTDGDGIPDGQENPDQPYVESVTPGTDPNLADTDLDGFNDKAEFLAKSDPTDINDVPVVPKGLVAHYKFNEPAGAATAVNAAGGTSPGAVGSAVVTGVTGISGNAYQFGNLFGQNDIVDMANAPFLDEIRTTKALTYTAWIKSTDTSSGRNTVICAADTALDNSYVDCGIAGAGANLGALSGRLRPNGNIDNTEIFSNTAPSTTLVNTDTWHHIALTVDLTAHVIRIFVDGVQVGENNAVTAAAFPVFNNFEIGRLGRKVPTDAYQGLVDDVQVYSEALSPARIASLFAMPGVSADEDHDRLDDQWEITNFGSIAAQNGSGDPDGDGILNEEEETAGTTPGTVAAPRILSANFVAGGNYVIQFTGAPNTVYRVTKSTTLGGGSFGAMTPAVTATTNGSGSGTATVPAANATGARGFYRLETP